jgi:hypothetical protein
MNKKIWNDAYKRAAEMAPVRPDRRMRDILYGDVPTFMELPRAGKAAELKDTDIAFLGMGYEGVKVDSPHSRVPIKRPKPSVAIASIIQFTMLMAFLSNTILIFTFSSICVQWMPAMLPLLPAIPKPRFSAARPALAKSLRPGPFPWLAVAIMRSPFR